MPFYIFNTDISDYVQRDTVNLQGTMAVNNDGVSAGSQTLSFMMNIPTDSNIKIRTGNTIFWTGDDGNPNNKYFGGVITNISFKLVGFGQGGSQVYQYDVMCRDASYLFENKTIEGGKYNQSENTYIETTGETVYGDPLTDFTNITFTKRFQFPNYIGNSIGGFMDALALYADPRIQLASDNDESNGTSLAFDYEVARTSYRQLIDQLASEGGLIWWVDSDFRFHHKTFQSFIDKGYDPYFDLTESSQNYYDLSLTEDFDTVFSRVTVVGNFHDGGFINEVNRQDGVKQTEEISVIITNVAAVDEIKRRNDYPTIQREGLATMGGQGTLSFRPDKVGIDGKIYQDFGPSPYNVSPPGVQIYAPTSLAETDLGIKSTVINVPNAYFDTQYEAYTYLVSIGKQYLAAHAKPRLFGSVKYNDHCPKLGDVINIHLDKLGIYQKAVVAGINITSSGDHCGNTHDGKRKYEYKVDFSDYGYHLRFDKLFYRYQYYKRRARQNIKPLPPEVLNAYYTMNGAEPVLQFEMKMPNRNAEFNDAGLRQNIIPPVIINEIRCRVTANPLALSNPDEVQIAYSHYSFKPKPINTHLEDLSRSYNQYSNDYIGEIEKWRINWAPLPGLVDGRTVFYQLRSVTNAGVLSDWTAPNSLSLGQNKDKDNNNADPPDGFNQGVSNQQASQCCPTTPVTPPPPPPPPMYSGTLLGDVIQGLPNSYDHSVPTGTLAEGTYTITAINNTTGDIPPGLTIGTVLTFPNMAGNFGIPGSQVVVDGITYTLSGTTGGSVITEERQTLNEPLEDSYHYYEKVTNFECLYTNF